ncbi:MULTISPECIES: LytTR family DNA-binding domain-containing protein [unclassified Spirosoma]|uniref:LytR/AlgR family response regulator transcription factor n=1 Tax=unclassified Spirosoma TaxID=2621999 RepID=UPI00096715C2|nr:MULTISPECIES: LytTR family DNA-binding domain-containing protein [unclassified Spirosoma]MBN8826840.1 response regulator transcription factor [Spirosoma sp.]OJW80342.1 MAG: DNA-binding response regulator [Spirosoma sp. 48-14]
MNVLIVEDEPLTAQRLEILLLEYDPQIQVLAQLPSVSKAVQWFNDPLSTEPELIFLDIHLEDDLGFNLIKKLNLTIPIIFTTAFDEYALQAFKANSIDYLLKPIETDELAAAIDKFKMVRQASATMNTAVLNQLIKKLEPPTYRDRFMVSVGPRLRSIRIEEIAYFFFEEKATYVMPHTGVPVSIDYSLDKLGQLVDPDQFFRVNRSYLVSASGIRSVYAYSGSKLKVELAPQPRQEVFVSIDRVTSFKEWMGK